MKALNHPGPAKVKLVAKNPDKKDTINKKQNKMVVKIPLFS
jgi:hypothetical protein